MTRAELLSPAGDSTCLTAALKAGADAVYFGAGTFNMRRKARNFSLDDLQGAVAQCRGYNARAYLTLNTIIYENELSALETVLDRAQIAGIDAIIGWDPAVIRGVVRRGMEMHLSTQASVSNSAGIIELYRRSGIRRYVMAREFSLDHIPALREGLRAELGEEAERIELEFFIHGAMCVSVSGRCFLSESATGDSGNRGECLQPCRREYRIIDVEGEYEYEIGRDYVLSPKDLCTMPFIDKILQASPACLKIEGRMRNPEYVSTVTGAYRRIIDAWYEAQGKSGDGQPDSPDSGAILPTAKASDFDSLKQDLIEELGSVFNRGFHSGFFMGKPVAEWAKAPNSQARYRKETVGTVVNYYPKAQVAEIRIQGASIGIGDQLVIQGPTTGNLFVMVEELRVDNAAVPEASKNEVATVKVDQKVRRGDAAFRRYLADTSAPR